jgi:multiple sugar transport system substrate-binding protein
MNIKKNIILLASILLLAAMVFTACSPAAAPTTAPEEPTEAAQPTVEPEQPTEVVQPTAEPEQPTEADQPTVEPEQPVEGMEPTIVEVWFPGIGEERDVLDAQVADFNAMQDAIVIDAVQLPEGSYNDQVNAAALAGDLPCLLDFDGPFLSNYAWSGYLTPLDGYLSDDLRADFLPSIINQGTYGGHLYGLGTFDSGLAIWGNKAYLDEAGVRIPTSIDDPWTKEEFSDALEKLQALPEVDYAIDFKINYGAGEWFTYGFSPILQSFGGDLIDRSDYESADGVLNGPESVEAMTYFQSLFEDGYAEASQTVDDCFYRSKTCALSWVGLWMWGLNSDGLGDDLVVIPIPVFGEKAVTALGPINWGITSSCENPDAAWEFLNYLITPEEILHMTNANGAVPARKSAVEQSDLYAEGGPLNIFVQQLEDGVALERPLTPAYPVITAAFSDVIQNIVAGADVQEELDKAVTAIDQDIEDNQGYPLP